VSEQLFNVLSLIQMKLLDLKKMLKQALAGPVESTSNAGRSTSTFPELLCIYV
jgi:hypothetical protein